MLEPGVTFINRGVFNRVIQDAGFSASATLSYLKANRLIEASGRKYTKCKRISGVRTECVALNLLEGGESDGNFDDLPL